MTTPTRTKEIEVELENTPGTLADATEALSENGINILGFTCIGEGNKGTACFIADNPPEAIEALKGIGLKPKTRDALFVNAPNKPGQVARFSRKMAASGVNIERSFVASDVSGSGLGIGFTVDDISSAEKALRG